MRQGANLHAFLLPEPISEINPSSDWKGLFLEARRNGVFPLFYKTIRRNASLRSMIPSPFFKEMESFFYTHILRVGRLLQTLEEIVLAFQKNGLPFLLFKGFDLSLRIYNDLLARGDADIDFILPPKGLNEGRRILKSLGFESHAKAEDDFFRQGLVVELHRDIIHLKRFAHWEKPPLTIGKIWEGTETIPLKEMKIPVLDYEKLFLALSLHLAFHHNFRGLKWLADLAWMVKQGRINWSSIIGKAGENRLIPVLYGTLKSLEKTFAIAPEKSLLKDAISPAQKWQFFPARWDTKASRHLLRFGLLPDFQSRMRMIRETLKHF